jgi:hypothetical protein
MAEHLHKHYNASVLTVNGDIVLNLCERPAAEDLNSTCVICGEEHPLSELQEHLTEHMEDLSLFVLPQSNDDDEEAFGSTASVQVANSEHTYGTSEIGSLPIEDDTENDDHSSWMVLQSPAPVPFKIKSLTWYFITSLTMEDLKQRVEEYEHQANDRTANDEDIEIFIFACTWFYREFKPPTHYIRKGRIRADTWLAATKDADPDKDRRTAILALTTAPEDARDFYDALAFALSSSVFHGLEEGPEPGTVVDAGSQAMASWESEDLVLKDLIGRVIKYNSDRHGYLLTYIALTGELYSRTRNALYLDRAISFFESGVPKLTIQSPLKRECWRALARLLNLKIESHSVIEEYLDVLTLTGERAASLLYTAAEDGMDADWAELLVSLADAYMIRAGLGGRDWRDETGWAISAASRAMNAVGPDSSLFHRMSTLFAGIAKTYLKNIDKTTASSEPSRRVFSNLCDFGCLLLARFGHEARKRRAFDAAIGDLMEVVKAVSNSI